MNTNLELIEKYIDGELGDEENIEFKNLLDSSNDLKRDYNLSLEVNNSIAEDDVIALRETLEYMYNDDVQIKRIPNVFTKRRIYYAAASAALLLATGGLIQRLSNHDLSNELIFDKYYSPYEVTVTYRSGNAEVDKILLNALEKYDNQEYEQALSLFEKVLLKKQNDMAVNLYTGITYMENQNYKNASASFNHIISDNNNLFIEQAKWYLAMCYVKTENDQKAKEVLNELIAENSYYKEIAQKVIKDLD